ncbi:PREDICTED: calcium-transporting ATPase [Prunus dulcis]|uniref:Calcium-transporting ATPase n=1 Tax=Prunus dulcis TaxID=3755 RepID=A0A5E4EEJ6_PRUDU|nr:calcium-transporting ATPase 12, plasma membrane-type isoform X1 [Prunus dulcis]VVA13886.1 PREDICTED: calcium-transporting ATPase [Prunus dulcis]
MLSRSSDCSTSLLDELDINLRAKRRWRMAYLALRVVRVMLELPKEIISRASNYEGDDEIVHYSFVPNIEDDEDAGLKEMAKEKDSATGLSEHGGVFTAGLATSDYTKSHYDYGKFLHDITTITFTRAKKRWRMAFAAIYAVRAMLSLPKEIVAKRNNYKHDSEIFHSFSHTAPDIELGTALDLKPRTKSLTDAYGFVPNPDFDHAGLTTMVKERDLGAVNESGGVIGIAASLRTNPENGIYGNDLHVNKRREVYGSNTYHKQPPKGLLYFVMDALKDTTILILCVCAALSLGFGIKEHGAKEGWYEGGSIFVAVFIVIVVSALSNFRQELQFDKLSKISSNIKIEVLRDRQRQQVSIFDIVVGDVVFLKLGDQIPADGLFLDGRSLQVDESSMTGESDHVEVDSAKNPFLLSGAKVVDGYAQMLVTSVGMNTAWGEMMSSISQDTNERTPLQARLDKLTSTIGKVGLIVAFLVLVVLLIRYFTGNTKDEYGNKEYSGSNKNIDNVLNGVVRIVSAAVTIVVVAIPEGLPLAVTLTLAYSMKRMMKDQAMVRKLQACETMGSATVICTDKTGTLTKNEMEVTKFWLGQEPIEKHNSIKQYVSELFHQGVGLNTTGSVYIPLSGSKPNISGSPTEKAILYWAVSDLGMDMEKMKPSYDILHVETFNSEKKRSGVLIKKKEDKSIHVHWKGAAEMIVAMCSSYYETDGAIKSLDEESRSNIEKIIQGMAASSLRCIAFAHTQILEEEVEYSNGEKIHPRLKEDELILLGVVGLKDPCRPGVLNAVKICRSAGVQIKMITGDNVFTAKAIATECGILQIGDEANYGEQVIEGVEFRNYTHQERMEKVDNILVMARSSPFDKLLMVQCLKQKNHVVAVTGDGTNDAPALKEADIGLSMGIQGTEVAKESSDIIILDDNFNSVATVLRWGRCVYNNIQKFIQFQLTVNVAALVINFIAAVSAGDVPLTAVQLLWVNLIMDTLGALALATERPTNELMQKQPVGRTAPLITNIMWRNLLFQALYQIAVLLILQFRGESIFNVTGGVNDTLIFNTFVLCQVFNEFNSRSMEKQNVFKGIHRNRLFIGIVGVTILLQVVMVEFLKKFADTEKLNLFQWVTCILIAAVSWPIGWIVKCIPVPEEPVFEIIRRSIVTFKRNMRA